MNLLKLVAHLGLDKSEYEQGLSDAESKASGFGKVFTKAAKVGAAALTAATGAVAAFGASSVKAGMTFDSSMSQVAATMGTTVDQIQNLRDFAQEMGASTAFSASQAADALNYMALAGYDAETSMAMLPNVLNLAAAGGIELATASDMVTDAQSALGLSLEETATMVDQMAAASSASNTSVAQLGDAFLTIGATARNLSGGTQELATVLGVLADNGIKGAEGGTHLRNIILSLQSPTDDAAAALDALGISVYDSEGNMRSLIDIIGDMQKGLDGMDQASKDAIVSGIFNKTDLAAVGALLSTTESRFDELTGKINDSTGAAQKMADTQLDNLAGSVTLFQSALEGVQIAVSDGLSPVLKEFVDFGAEGLGSLATAFKEGGMEEAMNVMGEVLAEGLNKLTEHLPAMVEAGGQLLLSLVKGILNNLPEMIKSGLEIIVSLADGISESLPELIPTIVDVVVQIVTTLANNAGMLVSAALKLIVALGKGLIQAIPQLVRNVPEIVSSIVKGLLEGVAQIKEVGKQLLEGLWGGISDKVEWLKGKVSGVVDKIKGWFTGKSGFDEHSPSRWAADVFEKLLEGGEKGLEAGEYGLLRGVSGVVDSVKDAFVMPVPNQGSVGTGTAHSQESMRPIELTISLNGKTLARELYEDLQNENARKGRRLVTV